MEIVFYNSEGRPIAYSDDGEHIYLFDGRPVGFIDGDSIYAFSGRHLGFFENGWIWDHFGNAVFFTDFATGGPLKPSKQIKPLKGLKQLKPLKGLKELKPLKPLKTLSWSNLSNEEFFS